MVMSKEPRNSKFFRMAGDISLPGRNEGESVKEGGLPAGPGPSVPVAESVSETPSVPSGSPDGTVREVSREDGSQVSGRPARKSSGKGGRSGRGSVSGKSGRPLSEDGERIFVSKSFHALLGYEKPRRKLADGVSRFYGDLVEEAYLYYLKKNARDVYDRYVSMGLIDP